MFEMKTKKQKMVIISLLIVSVLLLSVGFAAFSSSLVIKSSAQVTADANDFKVLFSSKSDLIDTSDIKPNLVSGTAVAQNAKIANGDIPTISNIDVLFKNPGDSVQYIVYMRNEGKYHAYLRSVTMTDVTGSNLKKVCTPGEGADAELVRRACEGISLQVMWYKTQPATQDTTLYSYYLSEMENGVIANNGEIIGYLPRSSSLSFSISINYASDAARADGSFSVAFGDIVFGVETGVYATN